MKQNCFLFVLNVVTSYPNFLGSSNFKIKIGRKIAWIFILITFIYHKRSNIKLVGL